MLLILGKGIDYLVIKFYSISSKLLHISFGGLCLGVLVTGFTLGSYSHDAEYTMFQGRALVAVITAFFTFQITDLAELIIKIPGFEGLGQRIIRKQKSQGKKLQLILVPTFNILDAA